MKYRNFQIFVMCLCFFLGLNADALWKDQPEDSLKQTPPLKLKKISESEEDLNSDVQIPVQKKNRDSNTSQIKSRSRKLSSLIHESLFEKERVKRDLDVYLEQNVDELQLEEDQDRSKKLGGTEVRWENSSESL